MKIKTQSGAKIDMYIQTVEFSTTWLRIGKNLVGFNALQLHSAEIALTRIETITKVEFEIPNTDTTEEFWRKVLAQLDTEFTEQQRLARLPVPMKPRAKIHAVGTDLDLDYED